MRSLRLAGCYALYVLLSLAPVAVVVGLDWRAYTGTPQRCFSLSVVGMCALGLVVLHVLGHTPPKVRRPVWYGLAAALLWALRPIVDSLAMLMTALTAGELAALLVARPLITRCRRQERKEELAALLRPEQTPDEGKGRV